MRTFWVCLAVSVGLHLLFFQDVLQGVLRSGKADVVEMHHPEPVKIRLRKKPKPVVKKPEPKPKPKVAVKPKPKPKPKPVPPKPRPKIKPPAPRPIAKARPIKPRTIAKPRYPKHTVSHRPPPASHKRLSTTTHHYHPSHHRVAVPTSDKPSSGGRTGVLDNGQSWAPPDNSSASRFPDNGGDANGSDNGTGTQPVAPQPVTPPPEPPKPKPEPPKPKPAPPKPEPPKRSASHTPKARDLQISVPMIEPPAKFRHEKLKGQIKVRFNVSPDGSFQVSLSDSSGNKEFDDFILSQIRSTAVVQPAIDDDGNPKRSVVRRPVEINIE